MNLRTKTLVIIGLSLSALFILLYVTFSTILTRSFAEVEDQDVRRNVDRGLEALQADVDNLNALLGDWAPWDDTLDYVKTADPGYVESNLTDNTFTNLGINVMLFINLNGEVVYGKAVDLDEGVETEFPQGLIEHIEDNPLLVEHADTDSSHAGIVRLPEGAMMIASQPIRPSSGEGEIGGTLIMGRFVDDAQVASIAERIRLDTTISEYSETTTEINFASPVVIDPLSDDQIAGYALLTDLYGEPALILMIEQPRDIHAQGQQSLRLLVIALAVVGVFSIGLTLLLLERLVLARLVTLSDGVGEIGASGDLSRRLAVMGRDELGSLGGAINKMLQDLQDTMAREKALQQEVKQLRIEIDLAKSQKQVAEITESEYFQDLQKKAKDLRVKPPTAGE